MVPPWVPEIEPIDIDNEDENDADTEESDADPADVAIDSDSDEEVAPPARFRSSRRNLAEFARTGDTTSLNRALGHYVSSGYGGVSVATRRFGGTASTAEALGGALAGTPGTAADRLDLPLLRAASTEEVMSAVVDAVRPVDGTQDTESARASVREALSEVLGAYPDADLLQLTEDQQVLAVATFTATDLYRRFDLDVGKTIQDRAPDASTALSRLKEVRDYIRELIAGAFRRYRNAGQELTPKRLKTMASRALRETFAVFEGYLE